MISSDVAAEASALGEPHWVHTELAAGIPSCADAAQEPVEPLKTEYKQAINALETSLGHEDTQKVG